MREIKFRAWSKIRNKMSDCNVNMIVMWPSMRAVEYDGEGKQVDMELMQFTGLQDKNGVGIYEGDIVDGVLYKDYSVHIGKIQYDFSGYRIVTNEKSMTLCLTEKLRVIGNIHENKELLK